MKWKPLQMPKPLTADGGNNDRYGKFTLEPLERGFGHTLGTSLRRVLLSSLQGAAITSVRIEGVLHEFSTLPGVIEDVTEIVLNLKQVRLKLFGDGPKKGVFEMNGKGEVRAGDLKVDADVQVLNPDLHIATLNRDGDLRMEVEINSGRGYVSADQHQAGDRPIGVIPIDSLFSPVTKVNYTVEATRLGQRIDYDGKADRVKLIDNAEVRRYKGTVLNDQMMGKVITYENLTDVFTIDGRPTDDNVNKTGGRVRATLAPRKKPVEAR